MSTDLVIGREGVKTLRDRAKAVASRWYGDSLEHASRIHGLAGEIEQALKEALSEQSEAIQADGWLSPAEAEGLRRERSSLVYDLTLTQQKLYKCQELNVSLRERVDLLEQRYEGVSNAKD